MGLELIFEEQVRFEWRIKRNNPSRKAKDQPRVEMKKKKNKRKQRYICGFVLQN